MMNTQLLAKTAIASFAALGTVAIASPAQALGIKSYNVMDFMPHNGSSGHAFWMKDLADSGWASDRHFVFKDGPGTLTVDEDNNTANLTGTIVNVDAADELWNVNINFDAVAAPGGLKGAGYAPKISGNTNAQNAYAAWDFYDFVLNEVNLDGQGVYEGSSLSLTQADPNLKVQVGDGANDKNTDLGLSSWFHAEGFVSYDKNRDGEISDGETTTISGSYGDINVKLEQVPEPTSLLGLGAAALGIISLKRKQEQAAG